MDVGEPLWKNKAYDCLCIKKDFNSFMSNYRYFYFHCKFSQGGLFI